ncbi:hypothetical protein KYK29_10400 [Shinella daejeonensis]|uniref:DnaT-like ssDNA-binding protein n=1 Tax=Shinella daejeonensis TaxID=659017 RepID=UPI0020C78BD7|nr:DnaT-like ssDNA-binding protein [Shinella daejeonensis]MCP8895344.1 hypothetical protein [Shinella daejeonensis]
MLSYTEAAVTPAEASAYAEARGWSNWTGSDTVKAAAIRRSQDYIAGEYNGRWKDDWENDDAPEGVKFAIIEGARRELVSPGSLEKDLKRGGKIKAVGAGSARVEYMDGAPGYDTFTAIDKRLAPYITALSGGSIDLLRV